MNMMQRILKLMAQKYPTNHKKGMNPVLFIYDDESGCILQQALDSPFDEDNNLFSFSNVKELLAHLQEK